VKPPTSTRAPVWRSSAGTTSLRTRLSVSVVAASCGPVRGNAVIVATRPSGEIAGGATNVKSLSARAPAAIRWAAALSPCLASSATSRNDPLVPAPKP